MDFSQARRVPTAGGFGSDERTYGNMGGKPKKQKEKVRERKPKP